MNRGTLTWLLLGFLFGAAPGLADWLIAHGGQRIQTLGPWSVEGELVIFKRTNGTLSSLRVSDVDLEASSRAGTKSQGPPTPSQAERPLEERPAVVLSDETLPPVRPKSMAVGRPEEVHGNLRVAEVEEIPPESMSRGVGFVASVHNGGPALALGLSVTVLLYDESGTLLESEEADLSVDALAPGESAQLRASFPGIVHYNHVRFRVESHEFLLASDP